MELCNLLLAVQLIYSVRAGTRGLGIDFLFVAIIKSQTFVLWREVKVENLEWTSIASSESTYTLGCSI